MIFIAYETSSGLTHARALRQELTAFSLASFLAHDDLPSEPLTENWISAINRHIDDAIMMIVLVTPQAFRSREVFGEWTLMQSLKRQGKRKEIVPVFLGGASADALPAEWISISLYQAVPFDTNWRDAVEVLRARISGQGEDSTRVSATGPRSTVTLRLIYRQSVRDFDNELYVLKEGPERVNSLWRGIRSKVFIPIYRRFGDSHVQDEKRRIRFPTGQISFSCEKDDESLFGDRSSYNTEVKVELSVPSRELVADITAALGRPEEYVTHSVIPSATDVNVLFRQSSEKGIAVLAFEPRNSLRAKLPVGEAEAAVEVDVSQTEVTITSKEAVDVGIFDPTMIIRWMNGEDVMAELKSMLEPKTNT